MIQLYPNLWQKTDQSKWFIKWVMLTSMLRSDLCDYSSAYIVAKRRINVRATENTDIDQIENNALFRSYITKINITLIDNALELDIVMLMYKLLEYSQNYSMTSASL